MISLKELREKMIKEYGYYAKDRLILDTMRALKKLGSVKIHPGQDIFTICLEGPPGSGKSEFAKVYTKIASELLGCEVNLIKYQCDPTTGKSELYEDVNISAAIKGDADNVNIPGKLVEAIKAVNSGKKVVLFLDEFEKSREGTDTFLLEFLQSGQLNANQLGDLKVKEEYRHNLQVILAKNDARELTQPLTRRIEPSRLEHMKPETFYKVAMEYFKDFLDYEDLTESEIEIAKKGLDGIINLVCLMYNKAHDHEDKYTRLPSCSEMLIAIDAAYDFSTFGASKKDIYDKIMSNMFKNVNDIETFESMIESDDKTSTNDRLTELLKEMRERLPFEFDGENEAYDINDLIAEKIYPDRYKQVNKLKEELAQTIAYYEQSFKNINAEFRRMNLENTIGVEQSLDIQNAISNFYDESANIKRGVKVETIFKDSSANIGTFICPKFVYSDFIEILKKSAAELNIVLLENGILIGTECDIPLVVVANPSSDGQHIQFTFLSGNMIAHPNFIGHIYAFIYFVCSYLDGRNLPKSVSYQLSSLVYNEGTFKQQFDQVGNKNLYHVDLSENISWSTTNCNLTKTSLYQLANSDYRFTEEGYARALELIESAASERKRTMVNENN